MFSSGIITFRETLEVALVVGILLSYLTKTNQNVYKKYIWYGIGIGIVLAGLLAFFLNVVSGGFSGSSEEIFEGVLMFVTAGFLTWMILWVHRQKDIAKKLKEKVAKHVEEGFGWGIALLTISAVLREGVETVLYLKATSVASGENQMLGGFIGIIIALILGYVMFRYTLKFSLTTIFNVTGVLLIAFAAGMVAYGIHEFQEVGWIPQYSFDPIFNISHILDHKSTVGSVLRAMFGYSSRPTLWELIGYVGYIGFVLWLQKFTDKLLAKHLPR
jgi:high-affinity iron transporter